MTEVASTIGAERQSQRLGWTADQEPLADLSFHCIFNGAQGFQRRALRFTEPLDARDVHPLVGSITHELVHDRPAVRRPPVLGRWLAWASHT